MFCLMALESKSKPCGFEGADMRGAALAGGALTAAVLTGAVPRLVFSLMGKLGLSDIKLL